jgi:hypothetical protein
MMVSLDLLKDECLHEAWEQLYELGSMKDDLGRLLVPHCFHEKFNSNYFKFLMFQKEHVLGVVLADFEHKSQE